jgi:hypothetical protein
MSKAAGMPSYTVGISTRRCAATGRELTPGERVVSVLVIRSGNEDLARLDFADDAWSDGARPAQPLRTVGLWRSLVAEPGSKRRILIDDESLLELFESTGHEQDDGSERVAPVNRAAFRFVLALLLLRKRLLIQEGDRGGAMLVRPRGVSKPPDGPPLMEVSDPALSPGVLARVIEDLGSVLSDDGNPDSGATRGGAAL